MNTLEMEEAPMSIGQFNWTNLFAGMLVAIAAFVILMTFGLAIAMSVGDRNVGRGFAIWSALVGIVSLFWGSAVMTSSNRETHAKSAVLQGLAFWGTVIVAVSALSFIGMNLGLNTFLSGLGVMGNENIANTVARALRQYGITEDQITSFSIQVRNAKPSAGQAWTSFIMLLLTIAACIGGSLFSTQKEELGGDVGFRRERERFANRPQETPT